METPAGVLEEQALRQGGFTDEEVSQWKTETSGELANGGFSNKEIDEYFGVKNPDMSKVKSRIEENLKAASAPATQPAEGETKTNPLTPTVPGEPTPENPEHAEGFLKAIEAGFEMSVTGLFANRRLPDTVLPEHAGMAARLGYQVGVVAGDLPAMAAGMVAGAGFGAGLGAGVSGPAAPIGAVIGGAIGSGVGGFALPTAMRETLVDQYKNGDMKSFEDFWTRSGHILLETYKAGAVGAGTAGAGVIAGKALTTIGASPLARTATTTATEIATMTTLGKAIEGETPDFTDFLETSILIGGFHAVGAITNKALGVYKQTGIHPVKVLEATKTNPELRAEMAGEGTHLPKSLEASVSKGATPENKVVLKGPDGEITAIPQEGVGNKGMEGIVSSRQAAKEPKLEAFVDAAIDGLAPLKRVEEALLGKEGMKDLPIEQAVYRLARTLGGVEGMYSAWADFGPINFKTRQPTGTRGLLTTFKEMGETKRNEWRAYAIDLRALEKAGQGVPTGRDLLAAKKNVENASPEIKKYHKEIRNFREELLQYAIDGGVVNAKEAAIFREKNKDYVPMYRDLDGQVSTGRGGKAKDAAKLTKEMKGSEKDIIDPVESLLGDTYKIIKAVELNQIKKNLGDMATANPEAAAILGIKKSGEKTAVGESPIEATTKVARGEMSFFREGVKETWEVPQSVLKAFEHMDPKSSNAAMKIMAGFTNSLRLGVTTSPDFILRNIVRDQQQVFVTSKNGFIPGVDFAIGLAHVLKKTPTVHRWLVEGGANSSFTTFNKRQLETDLITMHKQTKIMDGVHNVVYSPADALPMLQRVAANIKETSARLGPRTRELIEATSTAAENATRIGEFARAEKKGKSSRQAAFESRDLLDYKKAGTVGRSVNQILAFWNANVQAKTRLVEALKDDPAGVSARMAAGVVLPTAALWWAYKDDPRWKDTESWLKNNFFVIFTDNWQDVDPANPPPRGAMTREGADGKVQVNNGIPFRIPMSQDMAAVSAAVRGALDYMYNDDPAAFSGLMDTVLGTVDFADIPTVFTPVIEQITNHALFPDRPLIPHHMVEGPSAVLPKDRYTNYTSETMKKISSLISENVPFTKHANLFSPIVMENYVRQWAGTNGAYALQLLDAALIKSGAIEDPVRPEVKWNESPFVKAFSFRYPGANSQNVKAFQDNYAKTTQAINSYKRNTKRGNFDEAALDLEDLRDSGAFEQRFKGVNEAMLRAQKAISMVTLDKNYTPAEKRRFIDEQTFMMINTATEANKQINEIRKKLDIKDVD